MVFVGSNDNRRLICMETHFLCLQNISLLNQVPGFGIQQILGTEIRHLQRR